MTNHGSSEVSSSKNDVITSDVEVMGNGFSIEPSGCILNSGHAFYNVFLSLGSAVVPP